MNECFCENCLFVEKNKMLTAFNCRRYPPKTVAKASHVLIDVFPCVDGKSWCGEWKEKKQSCLSRNEFAMELNPVEVKPGVYVVNCLILKEEELPCFIGEGISILENFLPDGHIECDEKMICKKSVEFYINNSEKSVSNCFVVLEVSTSLVSFVIDLTTILVINSKTGEVVTD